MVLLRVELGLGDAARFWFLELPRRGERIATTRIFSRPNHSLPSRTVFRTSGRHVGFHPLHQCWARTITGKERKFLVAWSAQVFAQRFGRTQRPAEPAVAVSSGRSANGSSAGFRASGSRGRAARAPALRDVQPRDRSAGLRHSAAEPQPESRDLPERRGLETRRFGNRRSGAFAAARHRANPEGWLQRATAIPAQRQIASAQEQWLRRRSYGSMASR